MLSRMHARDISLPVDARMHARDISLPVDARMHARDLSETLDRGKPDLIEEKSAVLFLVVQPCNM